MLEARGLEDGGEVQTFIDNEVMRVMEPYMQHDTGEMIKSMQRATTPGSGEVRVNTPYAHMRLHHGPTKGLRGPQYFERMKADRLDDILDGARKKAGGK
ncbi:MAG: capsid protein [Clostridia bacterium]|nr:capsid protein [Clostridia bacterium]